MTAPQGRIPWAEVVSKMNAWREAVDRMERRYVLSPRCHAHVYGVLNNQYEAMMSMSIVGSQDDNGNDFGSSEWPNSMTPSEIMMLAEIRALVYKWELGQLESLPPSTFEMPKATEE